MSKASRKRNWQMRKVKEGSNSTAQLNRIYVRDNGICQLCQMPVLRKDASRDHIVEISQQDWVRNLSDDLVQLAHKTCNNRKSNFSGSEARVSVKPKPLTAEAFPRPKPSTRLTYSIAEAFPDFPWQPSEST